jgi:hypothetical protein
MEVDAVLIEQPHAAQHLGVVQRELGEDPVVVEVDGDGLEVPDVDEEPTAEHEDQQQRIEQHPLEDAFHGRVR